MIVSVSALCTVESVLYSMYFHPRPWPQCVEGAGGKGGDPKCLYPSCHVTLSLQFITSKTLAPGEARAYPTSLSLIQGGLWQGVDKKLGEEVDI